MILTERVHYERRGSCLQDKLNEIVNDKFNRILFVTSEYYGNNEVGYTIIYENNKPEWMTNETEVS